MPRREGSPAHSGPEGSSSHGALLMAAVIVVMAACGDASGPAMPPSDDERSVPRVMFHKVAEFNIDELPHRYEGVAVSPDHRWYVVSTHRPAGSVAVIDAETFEVTARAPLPWSHGVGITPDGSTVVAGARSQTAGFRLPDLELGFLFSGWSLYVLASPVDESVFLSSWRGPLQRIDLEGRLLKRVDGSYLGVAISENGTNLLASIPFGPGAPRLEVFSLPDLTLMRSVASPVAANLVIPLVDPDQVLVMHGDYDESQAVVVNHLTGETGPIQRIEGVLEHQIDGYRPWPGQGNPWARVSEEVALVSSAHGVLVVDLRTGRVGEPLRTGEHFGLPYVPCCEIAYDRLRERVIFVSRAESRIVVCEVSVSP